jgi:hypothetical protein
MDFSPEKVAEIQEALDEADAEIKRGEGFGSPELLRRLGIQ